MHNASTKQRRAALRRRLGIWLGFSSQTPPKVRPQRSRSYLADIVRGLTPAPWRRPRPTASPATAVDVSSAATVIEGAPDATLVASQYIAVVDPTPPLTDLVSSARGATGEREDGTDAAGRGHRLRAILVVAVVLVALVLAGALALRRAPRDGAGSASAPTSPAPLAQAPVPALAPARDATPPTAGTMSPAAGTAARASTTAPATPEAEAEAEAGGDLVEVRQGDTLWSLSAQRYGDPFAWPRLFAQNRDRITNPDLIYPGQRLRIAGEARR